MHLLHGRDQWRALIKTVTNLRVSCKAGNILTSSDPWRFLKETACECLDWIHVAQDKIL
jgi:hypothetical protein